MADEDATPGLDEPRRQVQALAAQALASLEARGWPGATLIRTQGGFFRKSRGGWLLARWSVVEDGRPRTIECYLLQNGKLSVGVAPDGGPVRTERPHDAGEISIDSSRADAVLTRAGDLMAGLRGLID
ncbi:hypothetical protein [Nocardioides ferulae]|uniref:hypothetical protein n=1 Tax=Nocardioides ferulae TaxID=2340821 RepID=UPI000EB0F987|nr:hypothetical protein [Nocardioides ferulae]